MLRLLAASLASATIDNGWIHWVLSLPQQMKQKMFWLASWLLMRSGMLARSLSTGVLSATGSLIDARCFCGIWLARAKLNVSSATGSLFGS